MATSTLRFQATVALLFVLGGCERGVPVAVQPGPQSSLGSASLSPAAWELLTGKINVAALDRLLTTLGPEDRARLLRSFEDAEWAASGRTDMETRDVVVTVRFGDPERQRLLEHVWRPFWSQLPPSLLQDASHAVPGRALVAARRADSVSATAREPVP